ncbi:MAG: RagB/SusD family nutrient uptake outer membrane protein [Lutibacter sp.]|nr:MAG: hypothetical protein APF83_01695 [Lutibacter sp. BRH_c52]
MKIYKIITFLIIPLVLITISSCTSELDTQPYSFNTVDKLYTSASGAELGLTGCYNILNAENIQETAWASTFVATMPFMLNGGTDEVVTQDGFTDPSWSPFGNGSYTQQNPKIKDNWFALFAGINRVNYLLEKIDGVEMDDVRRNEIKGEAHFLRGIYYFYLAIEFGGLPIYTKSDVDINQQRQSLELVYSLVIDDLNFAYNALNDRADKIGRANKWSAAGYLSKVYTYLASCKTNNVGQGGLEINSFGWVDANTMYENAFNVTEDIIAKSGLKLTENYDYLFRETTEDAKYEESLFSVLGSKTVGNGNLNLYLFWQIPVGQAGAGGGYGWMRPVGELFNKYDESDIRRSHNLTQSLLLSNPTESIEGITYYIPIPLTDPFQNDLCVGKFRYRAADQKDISSAWSDGNFSLIRLADILLLNAEARYFNGDEAGARERLKEVISRVALDTDNLNTLTTNYYNADFVTELLDSRSRELCFEGWRRIDLIRFGKIDQTIASLGSDKGRWNSIVPLLQADWKTEKMWFPIPQSEIDLSPLDQNPGY